MLKTKAKIQNKTKNIYLTKQSNWIRAHRANLNKVTYVTAKSH